MSAIISFALCMRRRTHERLCRTHWCAQKPAVAPKSPPVARASRQNVHYAIPHERATCRVRRTRSRKVSFHRPPPPPSGGALVAAVLTPHHLQGILDPWIPSDNGPHMGHVFDQAPTAPALPPP